MSYLWRAVLVACVVAMSAIVMAVVAFVGSQLDSADDPVRVELIDPATVEEGR